MSGVWRQSFILLVSFLYFDGRAGTDIRDLRFYKFSHNRNKDNVNVRESIKRSIFNQKIKASA